MGEPAATRRMSQQASAFPRNAFGLIGDSSPTTTFRTDIFGSFGSQGTQFQNGQIQNNMASTSSTRLPSLTTSSITDPSYFEGRLTSSIVLRKLSPSTSQEALASMLVFSSDFIDVNFVRSAKPDDQGYKTAIARFRTPGGAHEAHMVLDGKANTTKDANMIVEIQMPFERRNTIDGSRSQTSSASSSGSVSGGRSRFNSTFQSTDRNSPPSAQINGATGELPAPETSPRFQQLFSAPISHNTSFPPSSSSHFLNNDLNQRISGKSTINDDSADDETGELLRDPVAFAQGNHQPQARRGTTSQVPITRFGSLSLNAGNGDNQQNGLSSPTTNGVQAGHPNLALLRTMASPTGRFARVFPPVNPNDQHQPCNTLYVGNLPLDTTEDELKGVFSKCRGYKRLCFRTKSNGPMCFVEFEDVAYATKALYALYGIILHGSANSKGGIRLSFSKNPLGVRGPPSQQPNGVGGPNAARGPGPMAVGPPPGYNPMANGYSSVSGPPPGLGNSANTGRPLSQRERQPRGPPPPGMDGSHPNTNGSVGFGFGMAAGPGMANQGNPRTMSLPVAGPAAGYNGPMSNGMGSGMGRGNMNYSPHMLGRQ